MQGTKRLTILDHVLLMAALLGMAGTAHAKFCAGAAAAGTKYEGHALQLRKVGFRKMPNPDFETKAALPSVKVAEYVLVETSPGGETALSAPFTMAEIRKTRDVMQTKGYIIDFGGAVVPLFVAIGGALDMANAPELRSGGRALVLAGAFLTGGWLFKSGVDTLEKDALLGELAENTEAALSNQCQKLTPRNRGAFPDYEAFERAFDVAIAKVSDASAPKPQPKTLIKPRVAYSVGVRGVF